MLLSTQEKSFGLNKLGKGPLSSDKVCRENTDPLKKKKMVLPLFTGRHLLGV